MTSSVDTSKWSGEGEFTQTLINYLERIERIVSIRVEDAPAKRSDVDFNFISNELFVGFETHARVERQWRLGIIPVRRLVPETTMSIRDLEASLSEQSDVGPPAYGDEGMLQYLRTERVIPPYQTRGYKLVELVRIYQLTAAAVSSGR